MKNLLNISSVIFAVVVLLVLTVKPVGAIQLPQVTICHTQSNPDQTQSVNLAAVPAHLAHGDYLGPCNEPSPSPSPTPSPSPSPEVSPSPTPDPCEEYVVYNEEWEEPKDCEEPEPTPTPSPEPEATPSGQPLTQGAEGCSQDCHPSSNPPVCNGLYAEVPAWVHVDRVSPTEVKIQWATNNADKLALIYGYVGEDLVYGIPHLNGDSREVNIGSLEPNRPINVQLYAYRGECSVSSVVIDP